MGRERWKGWVAYKKDMQVLGQVLRERCSAYQLSRSFGAMYAWDAKYLSPFEDLYVDPCEDQASRIIPIIGFRQSIKINKLPVLGESCELSSDDAIAKALTEQNLGQQPCSHPTPFMSVPSNTLCNQ